MASVVGTINPALFRQSLSNDILLIIVLGGTGTITGSILGGCIFIIAREALRFLDNGFAIGRRSAYGLLLASSDDCRTVFPEGSRRRKGIQLGPPDRFPGTRPEIHPKTAAQR